jgi:hypothetical protein
MGRISRGGSAIRTCALLGLVVLAVAPSGAVAKPNPVLPPSAHPHGQSYSAWAAEWWQWALEQPTATNPLVDPTGANCASGQQGRVWFLAGTIASGPVERSCTVPTGTTLVFPVVNAFTCVDPGAPDPGVPALRSQLAHVRDATGLTATIDGAAVRNIAAYYEESDVFSLRLPADNILGAPAGLYTPCVDAGYYLAVRPLKPGEHTIHFSGSLGALAVDVTYHITVAPRHR